MDHSVNVISFMLAQSDTIKRRTLYINLIFNRKNLTFFTALEFITDILSDDIRVHFQHLCRTFQERANQRNLTRVVGDGIKQNPELLNSIGEFMIE